MFCNNCLSDRNLPKFLVSEHLEKQHKIISCVYQISGTYTFSQTFSNLDATIQTFSSLGQARF